MKPALRPTRVYHGWWIVLVTGIVSGVGLGVFWFGVSVIFKPLAADLGFSRTITSAAIGIGRMVFGGLAPVAGALTDKYGGRWVMTIGVVVAGIGLVLMNYVYDVWSYIVVWALVVGVGTSISLTVTVDRTVADWFVRRRGAAIGIKFALVGVATVLVLPLTGWLVEAIGWRGACVALGGILLVSAPLIWRVSRFRGPGDLAPTGRAETDAARERRAGEAAIVPVPELSPRDAFRTRGFWTCVVASAVQAVCFGGFGVHMVPFLTDYGIEPTEASALFGLSAFFAIPGRLVVGVFSDYFRTAVLARFVALLFLLQAFGFALFLVYPSMFAIYVILVVFGLALGSPLTAILLLIGRYFGTRSLGVIWGSILFAQTPFAFLSPIMFGWIFDRFGSYAIAFEVVVVLSIIAFATFLFSRPPAGAEAPPNRR